MENNHEIKKYFALFRRWIWLIILTTLLAGSVAFFVSRQMRPTYQSTTRILINQAPASQSTDYNSILTSEQLAQTYAKMITARPILDGVIQNLHLKTDPDQLIKTVTVDLVTNTQLIDVSVKNESAIQAAAIADELVKVFVQQTQDMQSSRYAASKQNLETQLADLDQLIKDTTASLSALPNTSQNQAERDRLEANIAQYQQTHSSLLQTYEQVRIAEAQSTSNLVQVQPATVPSLPVSPKVLQNTLLAALVGLLLALGGVFLFEYLDDTLKTPEEVTQILQVPVIGCIADMEGKEERVYVAEQPRSPIAEEFRVLRTNIEFAGAAKPIQTILVTSTGPAEGKTTVAINLAAIIAQSGKRVTLVDADLRRPRVHQALKIPNRAGFSDIFLGRAPIESASRTDLINRMRVITSGSLPPNPAEILGSARMHQILEEIKKNSDVVVLDSPPFVVSDAAILAARVDGVVIVVQPGVTYADGAASMMEQLHRAGARVMGVVLNRIPHNREYYYGGYRHYSPSHYHYETGDRSYSELKDGQQPNRRARKSLLSSFRRPAPNPSGQSPAVNANQNGASTRSNETLKP